MKFNKTWKNKQQKKPSTLPPHYAPLPLFTKKEIETERNKASDDFLLNSLQICKDELDAANESADLKDKIIIRDIIDPTPGLFIDDKLNPNEQNLQNTTDNVFNLLPEVQQQLNKTVFKKIIKQPIIQPTPPEIIPNVVPKTEDIGQPKIENHNDLVMISDDDKAKISKSLIKTDIEIKNKNNLKKQNKKKQQKTI